MAQRNGSANSEKLYGTRLNDEIFGGLGHDSLYGGGGNDTIVGSGSGMIIGGPGDDFIIATKRSQKQYHIYGDGGRDIIVMDLASKTDQHGHHVFGGAGADEFNFINTDKNTALMTGRLDDFNPHEDSIKIDGAVIDLFNPPSNVEIIYYREIQWLIIDNLAIYALSGAFLGEDRIEEVHFLKMDEARAIISSSLRVDYVDPENFGSKDYLNDIKTDNVQSKALKSGAVWTHYGKITSDIIKGTKGVDYIEGNKGRDSIYGGKGNDSIWGGQDNDLIIGGGGGDLMFGGDGADHIYGDEIDNFSSADDVIHSGTGNDLIYGGGGNDIIYGGSGDDIIYGGGGNDIIYVEDGGGYIRPNDLSWL